LKYTLEKIKRDLTMTQLENIQCKYDDMDKYTTTYEDTYGEIDEEDINWYNDCTREHLELMGDINENF
jgi:hypothetical protein